MRPLHLRAAPGGLSGLAPYRLAPDTGRPVSHHPARATWLCETCGQMWPCPDARRQLASEYTGHRPALGLYMAAHYELAYNDLRHMRPGDVWERFFGWVRSVQ